MSVSKTCRRKVPVGRRQGDDVAVVVEGPASTSQVLAEVGQVHVAHRQAPVQLAE